VTFAEFIDQKSVEKLSLVLGAPPNTIYSWKHLNRIPRRVWPDLMLRMPEVGLNDLVAMESLSPGQGRGQ
jgi:hypothetical protein